MQILQKGYWSCHRLFQQSLLMPEPMQLTPSERAVWKWIGGHST
jgi:hypothetical protein